MPNASSPLSSISYTNKDFRDIYPELLDLVKQLTYKWDPSISNESDPGVILLKLNAIIADKNNYNIDKNVLEVFPETLTQEVSARNMYHQLAYEMPWYRSATTDITLKWAGRDLEIGEQVRIPAYTMICDSDSNIVYTLTSESIFSYDSITTTTTAIQGVIEDVSVNGTTDIHLVNLDHNNRLYLDDYSIAENGIFITNIGTYNTWTRVPNLAVQPLGNTFYEFGIDSRSNRCYLEFPEDIEVLMQDGLNIKYLLSDGVQGNVAAKVLTSFYDDTTVTLGNDTINLNNETCVIYNASAAVNGSDPQSISDAYKSFRRVSGTFDTLVTLRDYINAIYTTEIVSNDIVSDRNNDVQCSYTIVTDNAKSVSHRVNVSKTENVPDMDAFDLKMYLLNNPGTVDTLDDYQSTFDMVPYNDDRTNKVKTAIENQKCVAHDFQPIKADIPCLFRIAYPLRIKIVPQYKLTDMQQASVQQAIILALYKELNSRKVDFGVEPSYDVIYDIVSNADERIKLAIVDDFNYTTFATYWYSKGGKEEFRTIPLNNYVNDPYIKYSSLEYAEAQSYFNQCVKDSNRPSDLYFVCNEKDPKVYVYDSDKKVFVPYAVDGEVDSIRKQIITKNVLAGVTPLFKQETLFKYTLDQQMFAQPEDVERVTTVLNISPFGYKKGVEVPTVALLPDDRKNMITTAKYTLKDNESLQFLAPSLVSKRNFSNYVAYQFIKQTPTSTDEYLSISWDTYESLVNKDLNLYAFSEAFTYVTIKDDSQHINQLDDVYVTPLFVPNFYYTFVDGKFELIGTKPDDWGAEQGKTYYKAPQLTAPINFSRYNGITMRQAWKENKLGVYYQGNVYIVPANTDYRLQPGDSIVFFYTEEQASNSPYTYECYRGTDDITNNPIIRATFTLSGIEPTSASINISALLDTGYIPYNTSQDSAYQRVYEMFSKYALSGNQSIDIRDINQKLIKTEQNYYYFITNSIEEVDDKQNYVMSLVGHDLYTTNPYYVYTLQTDEYFIYTDKNKVEYEILGPGTLIRLMPSTIKQEILKISVPVVDYKLIANQGISSFEQQCVLFPYPALLTEQQIYNFTKGDVIQINLGDAYTASSKVQDLHIEITEEFKKTFIVPTGYTALVESAIYGITVGDTTYTIVDSTDKIVKDTSVYVDWSAGTIQFSSEDTTLQKTKEMYVQELSFYQKSAFPEFDSRHDTYIRDFDISYSTNGGTFEQLPGIAIGETTAVWKARATLNIDSSFNDPQVIDNHISENAERQSYQQLGVLGNMYPEDSMITKTPYMYFLTNVAIARTGGEDVDVTYLTGTGERKSVEFFLYSLNDKFDSTSTGFYKQEGNIFHKTLEQAYAPATNMYFDSAYKYIIGAQNSATDVKFALTVSGGEDVKLSLLNGDTYHTNNVDSPTLDNSRRWYFTLSGKDLSNLSLNVIIEGSDETGSLFFDDLVKYNNNDIFQDRYGISTENIIETIKELDTQGEFKYNYSVDAATAIEDPIVGKSFFSSNHVFNNYAISEAVLKSPNEKSDQIKTIVSIVNNR